MARVFVPPSRVGRWCENFSSTHGTSELNVDDGALRLTGADGSSAQLVLPFAARYTGPAEPIAFAAAATVPAVWGILLVRKGGFAVARLCGPDVAEHKIGQRHVQGRSKAGGQSQRRFARRRDNQARAAYGAAADHADRLLGGHRLQALILGGDTTATAEVMADRRLARFAGVVVAPYLSTGDPKRVVLDAAIEDAQAVWIEVVNRTQG